MNHPIDSHAAPSSRARAGEPPPASPSSRGEPPPGSSSSRGRGAAEPPSLIVIWQQLTHRLLAALDHDLADLGLSAAEIHALACFGGTHRRTVGELVAATALRPSTLTGVLDRLERRELIGRVPNPADRRSILVRLTPSGRAHAARVAEACAALERRIPACEVRRALAALDEVA
jgi:MarR family transcriptional regulator, organic hydroperoxide resistance regulator